MSVTIEGLGNKFIKWNEAFVSKGLKANLGKTKVMVSCSITKDGMSKSKVDPCWICSFIAKANSDLCPRRALDFVVEGQRKKGRSKEEGEVKGRRRSRKEGEVKERRGGQMKRGCQRKKGVA